MTSLVSTNADIFSQQTSTLNCNFEGRHVNALSTCNAHTCNDMDDQAVYNVVLTEHTTASSVSKTADEGH